MAVLCSVHYALGLITTYTLITALMRNISQLYKSIHHSIPQRLSDITDPSVTLTYFDRKLHGIQNDPQVLYKYIYSLPKGQFTYLWNHIMALGTLFCFMKV